MNDLAKMNLIAIVQQLPKDDIDFIQTYITIMEEKVDRLNNIINELEKEMKQEYTVCMCKNKSYGKTVQYGIDIAREHYYKRLQELKENK